MNVERLKQLRDVTTEDSETYKNIVEFLSDFLFYETLTLSDMLDMDVKLLEECYELLCHFTPEEALNVLESSNTWFPVYEDQRVTYWTQQLTKIKSEHLKRGLL